MKPGRFHPRCVACKAKFLLVISADANVSPQTAIEHDPREETISPAIASVLGVNNEPPRAPQIKRVPKAVGATSVPGVAAAAGRAPASTHATMAPRVGVEAPPSDVQSPVTHAHRQTTHGHLNDDDGGGNAHTPLPFENTDPVYPGTSIGGYLIEQKLGEGGMGSVYLAKQMSLDRSVALKMLSPALARDPQFVARFTREAYAAAQLTHHNVVQIHDIGAEQDLHFFSMEFVEGKTLSRVVADSGKVESEQAVGFILQAARGFEICARSRAGSPRHQAGKSAAQRAGHRESRGPRPRPSAPARTKPRSPNRA